MKLLFDQNLSPRLVMMLGDLFPGSEHVQGVGFGEASDASLWEFARDNAFVIVTKDVDFSDRSAIAGHPPKIIWIRLGNCSTAAIASALRNNHAQTEAFEVDDDLGVLALFR